MTARPGSGVEESGRLLEMLQTLLRVDASTCQQIAVGKATAFPGLDARSVASKLVSSYARKGGLEGFLTGLPSNPAVMIPAALADIAVLLRFYAVMTAAIGYLSNPRYFDDPDWRDDALLMLAGPKAVSRILEKAGVAGAKQGSKVLIKKYLSKEVLKAVQRWVLKWFGKKVTQRAIIAKAVPVVGGGIGAIWNILEIKVIGSRIVRYHFDAVLK